MKVLSNEIFRKWFKKHKYERFNEKNFLRLVIMIFRSIWFSEYPLHQCNASRSLVDPPVPAISEVIYLLTLFIFPLCMCITNGLSKTIQPVISLWMDGSSFYSFEKKLLSSKFIWNQVKFVNESKCNEAFSLSTKLHGVSIFSYKNMHIYLLTDF